MLIHDEHYKWIVYFIIMIVPQKGIALCILFMLNGIIKGKKREIACLPDPNAFKNHDCLWQ